MGLSVIRKETKMNTNSYTPKPIPKPKPKPKKYDCSCCCPNCGSIDIDWGTIEVEVADVATYDGDCEDCGTTFTEIYEYRHSLITQRKQK